MSILERYQRAARLTAPKIAAETAGVAVDGYWLSATQYYFLSEKFDATLGRLIATPSIADAETGSIREVIPLQDLAELLSAHRGMPITEATLASAEFDMPDRVTLAVTLDGHEYLVDARQKRITLSRKSPGVPALYSPDGRFACIVRGFNLALRDLRTGSERALTTDGVEHNRYGQQSETGLAAVSMRKCPVPVGLWSPDSQWFLTHRIDEREVPEISLVQHAPPGGGRPLLHTFKYPFPGDPLPRATYVAIHVSSGRVVTFESVPDQIMVYSPFFWRTVWFTGENSAALVRMDRYFREVTLISLDLARGTTRALLSESVSDGYVDVHPMMSVTPNIRVLRKSREIIWFSERDGWGHLYLYDAESGALKNRITQGEWLVRDIVHVDESNRRILFLASGMQSEGDPVPRALCTIQFDGSGFEKLYAHSGDVFIAKAEPSGVDQHRPFRSSNAPSGVSPDGRKGIVRFAHVERGNRTMLVDLRRPGEGLLLASASPAPGEVVSRAFSALAADGVTPLHGTLFLPSDFNEHQRYPLIDYIYPGPHIVHKPQSFRSVDSSPARSLAELGFATIMIDTRGTPFRSRAFHQCGYGQLKEPQLADHVAVVGQLCSRFSFLDAERIGMVGHSAGGSATARALCDYGDVFKVGVSVCGEHDATWYTSMWSDKYRGPGDRSVWDEQWSGANCRNLSGKLLLISGDMDENVPVSQTLLLVDALVRANRDFDLLIVPNAGHMLMMDHPYVQRRIWDYFVRHLLGDTPPARFELTFEAHEVNRFMQSFWREIWQ